MASCIDTQRSLALGHAARSSAVTSANTIFHCSNYPLLKKIHVNAGITIGLVTCNRLLFARCIQ